LIGYKGRVYVDNFDNCTFTAFESLVSLQFELTEITDMWHCDIWKFIFIISSAFTTASLFLLFIIYNVIDKRGLKLGYCLSKVQEFIC